MYTLKPKINKSYDHGIVFLAHHTDTDTDTTQTDRQTHTHTDTHTNAHANTHTFTHARSLARTHARTHMHARTHARIHARTHTHTHTHTYTHIGAQTKCNEGRARVRGWGQVRRQNLKSLVVLFAEVSFYCSFEGVR